MPVVSGNINVTLSVYEASLLTHLLGSISRNALIDMITEDGYYVDEAEEMNRLKNNLIDKFEELGIEL